MRKRPHGGTARSCHARTDNAARSHRRVGIAILAIATLGVVALSVGPAAAGTYPETTGGDAHTWTNYANAGGYEGPTIPGHTTVQVTCALHGFAVANGNDWWYQIGSDPWNNKYYVSADAFYNNGQTSGSLVGTPYVDSNVPVCGSSPPTTSRPSPSNPSVSLSRGSAAPSGSWYSISISDFHANSGVSVSCYDSVSPSGFRTFTMRTDGGGSAATSGQCYSGDGPDHWVVAGGVESNHVAWGSSGGTPQPPPTPTPTPTPTPQPQPQPQPNPAHAPAPAPETCRSFSGASTPDSNLSPWLFAHFEGAYRTSVVVPWAYFSSNQQFVSTAKSIATGQELVGWRAVFPSDMYFALGHFTIHRDSAHCFYIYDRYDFSKPFVPFWLQQKIKTAIPFDVWASGWLN
jgi:hypothetical protein